jgi:antitoxin (DNA-binding transcriptional repressor) of toxin-antitoxin stability system
MTNRIDVSRLPQDVVELLDAGQELVITRDDRPIAKIVSTGPAPAEQSDNVTVVATSMKLSPAARVALSEQLGPDYIVLDMHKAPKTADVVLVPPVSPQLIGSLRAMYPRARVVVVEIEDPMLGIRYEGPVQRLIDAGAETYIASTTIPRMATQLDHVVTRNRWRLSAVGSAHWLLSPQWTIRSRVRPRSARAASRAAACRLRTAGGCPCGRCSCGRCRRSRRRC